MQIAAVNDDTDFIDYLLENGADINGLAGCYRETPLMMASSEGNFKTVKHLIERGTNPFYYAGPNADWAIDLAEKYGHKNIFNYLTEIMESLRGK